MTQQQGTTSEILVGLLARALEAQAEGRHEDIETLCQENPEWADAVRAALGRQPEVAAWTRAAPSHRDLVGLTLGDRYRLEERIGAGAMGAVFRAADLELRREVAVKALQPHLFGNEQAEARFLREAETIAALRHPHIVAVHDRGVHEGVHYLVMELVSGQPLSRVLHSLEAARPGKRTVPSSAEVAPTLPGTALAEDNYLRLCVRWTADLAAALAVAHDQGIYHRDVKPSNVLIDKQGHAMLGDFGIAARLDDAKLTRDDTTLGTPAYMPPEQALGATKPKPGLDVYLLAATLYHLVAGRAPYEGDVREVLAAVQRGEPTPINAYRDAIPVDLQAVIECGMARELGRRYPTARAFEADLRAFLDYQPVTARRRGPIARAWHRARRSRLAQLTAVAVLIGGLALWMPGFLEARAAANSAQYLGLRKQLPPLLTLDTDRVFVDATARERLAALLDACIAIDADAAGTRTQRGFFRFDHGDRAGAAADFEALAGQGLVYAAALASRISSATESAALPLEGMPEPSTAADRFVAAHHAVRERDFGRANALLDLTPRDQAGAELQLLLRMFASQNDPEALRELRDDAQREEVRLAQVTALTRHVVGTTLGYSNQWKAAVWPTREAVELAPESPFALLNHGWALLHTNAPVEAEGVLRRALVLRPDNANVLHTLSRALCDQERFDEARQFGARILADGSNAHLRLLALGDAFLSETLRHQFLGDPAAAQRTASLAQPMFEELKNMAVYEEISTNNLRLIEAVLTQNRDDYTVALTHSLSQNIGNVTLLRRVVALLELAPPSPRLHAEYITFLHSLVSDWETQDSTMPTNVERKTEPR